MGTGAYLATGLPAGTYFARTFLAPTVNYVNEAYSNVSCLPCPPMTTTTPITVSAGATTPGIDFALSQGGGINGTVRDAGTGAPLSSVFVAVYSQTGLQLGGVSTNSAGVYSIFGLPTGTYFARTFIASTGLNYLDEAYDNFPCAPSCTITAATPIAVSSAAGATTPGIDFALTPGPGGGITGTVTDAGTGAPLSGVMVVIYSSTGGFVRNAGTNSAGGYSVGGLAPGIYFAHTFSPPTFNNIEEAYDNVPCVPCPSITTTTPITVVGTATTPGINFALSQGGGITGTASDAATGMPLQFLGVQVYSSTGAGVKFTTTTAAGVYTVGGLPTGTYFARTFVSSTLNYIDEAYNNVPCVPSCTITASTPIAVSSAAGAVTPGIDFALAVGAIITGTTTDAGTGAPGISINVQIYSSTGGFVKSVFSSSAGVYTVSGLPTGTYFARTGFSATYVAELYNNIACPHLACPVTTGAPIAVTAGTTQGGINFPLTPTGAADIMIDFGSVHGLWMASADGSWQQVHGYNPIATVTGDLDGNGRDDLVINFGPGIGVYAWMNHATWAFIHPTSPTQMVTGDLNNDGRDEVVFAFPGFGVWRLSAGSWSQLHGFDSSLLAVGRLDAVAGEDLIVDFAGYGLYVFANNASWASLHPSSATSIVTADLDGNGRDEAAIVFASYGLWVYNSGAWAQLHGLVPAHIAAGHLDTGNREDLVIDFGATNGLWTFRNNTTWAQLHSLTTQGLLVVDRNATASDEVLIDFGPAYGLWQYASNGTWSQLHGLSPEGLGAGRFR